MKLPEMNVYCIYFQTKEKNVGAISILCKQGIRKAPLIWSKFTKMDQISNMAGISRELSTFKSC